MQFPSPAFLTIQASAARLSRLLGRRVFLRWQHAFFGTAGVMPEPQVNILNLTQ
jgi:hypothetical protein